MVTQMTRAEYEAKYGSTKSEPVKMTRAEYEAQYGTQDKGYVSRVSDTYNRLAQDVMGAVKTGAETYAQGVEQGGIKGTLKATGGLLRSGLRTAGAVAEGAFTPILEAPIIKPTVEKVIGKVVENPQVAGLVTKATQIAKQYPDFAKDVQNIIDITTLGGGAVAEKPLIQGGRATAGDIVQGVKSALTPSEQAVQNKVIELFNKSIKPTAKKTVGQAEKYDNSVISALRTIKSNADSLNIEDATGELVAGRAPQTIQELAQGLEQTKDIVFKQYDSLAKQAGTSGAIIDAKPIAEEVAKVAENKALKLTNPEIIQYAENWADRLRNFDVLDTETTQEVIKLMNNNLQSFYKNPTYDAASKVAVDAGIANNFRQALDKAIEGATGAQYQALKNQYSALKAIENDVVRASLRDARKNAKGLLDYTDMFTSGQMITGIMSLNPAMFTKGALERGWKEFIKFQNDPNRAIKNIFDKLDIETGATFEPVSEVGKFLKNPKLGMSIEDVSKTDNLIQEAKKYKSAEDYGKAIKDKFVEEQGFEPSSMKVVDEWWKAKQVQPYIGIGGANPDFFANRPTLAELPKKDVSKYLKFTSDGKAIYYRGIPNGVKTRGIRWGDFISPNKGKASLYGKVEKYELDPKFVKQLGDLEAVYFNPADKLNAPTPLSISELWKKYNLK
jgi:hypothetical protein